MLNKGINKDYVYNILMKCNYHRLSKLEERKQKGIFFKTMDRFTRRWIVSQDAGQDDGSFHKTMERVHRLVKLVL